MHRRHIEIGRALLAADAAAVRMRQACRQHHIALDFEAKAVAAHRRLQQDKAEAALTASPDLFTGDFMALLRAAKAEADMAEDEATDGGVREHKLATKLEEALEALDHLLAKREERRCAA